MNTLSIIVNLSAPHQRSRYPLKDRITVEDGVTRIRPLRNGQPGGTEREVAEAIAAFDRAVLVKLEHEAMAVDDLFFDRLTQAFDGGSEHE